MLTRLLPFIYESEDLDDWEERFFWAKRRKRSRRGQIVKTEVIFDGTTTEDVDNGDGPEFEEVKPLAEELIDTLIDLLFFSDFTLPKVPVGKNKVSYAIWQSGVGCNTPVHSTKEYENNRTEILRLLLTITGKSMYLSLSMSQYAFHLLFANDNVDILPVIGVRAITYITTCPDKQVVLPLLCSLLNTVS